MSNTDLTLAPHPDASPPALPAPMQPALSGRSAAGTLVHALLDLNRRSSRRLTPGHVHEANVFGMYRKIGGLLLSHPDVTRVIDCGAGKSWQFPSYYKRWYGIHLIGLDIDPEEMTENPDLDEKITCDVTESIPVPSGSVDLVMVSSGIEHFRDNEAFLRHAYDTLRPGGFLVAQFPGRYAPFAIANRLLPRKAAKSLIGLAMRDDADVLGFTAHYDRTHYSAYSAMAKRTGFDVVYHAPGYYSSSYADFFLPLWLCSYAYDVLRFGLGIRDLASYNLFVLQKPGAAPDQEPLRLYAW
ncbi:class I SAM-dependent methyltransferase [Roseomonas sp. E05]|uniref:class I SAM-dependent methyltransferase n=1 Tax=Roseomonas sp. E05 TaxID=3046310 RepID=UPI0024B8DD89|nr:class I SAM-dependent methyltransferase [Roseomonas sp. E05]MDJ0388397.1 class I SAM-dependent methyltransferase [Roseomonas sp. E05]